MSNKTWKLGNSSKKHLEGVHEDLVKVVERALELSPYDFGITEGVRTLEKQKEYVASGKSQTMHSKHLLQRDDTSHAIDFMVYVNGKGTWEIGYYRKVVQAFFTAAIELGVDIESGALWRTLVDGPHLQLGKSYDL